MLHKAYYIRAVPLFVATCLSMMFTIFGVCFIIGVLTEAHPLIFLISLAVILVPQVICFVLALEHIYEKYR